MHRFGRTIGNSQFKAVGFELNNECLGYVFDYIKKNRQINKIVLDGNALGNEGLTKLTELIKIVPI